MSLPGMVEKVCIELRCNNWPIIIKLSLKLYAQNFMQKVMLLFCLTVNTIKFTAHHYKISYLAIKLNNKNHLRSSIEIYVRRQLFCNIYIISTIN